MLEPIDQLENLTREAVPTVFDGMVSMHVVAETPAPLPEDASGHLLASVGFTGDTTGIVFLSLSMTFARVITSQILGISVAEIDHDEMVADALGELSNQIAGYVKSRLCTSGKACMLTIPSVVRGQRMSLEHSSAFKCRVIGFRNSHHSLWAEVMLKT